MLRRTRVSSDSMLDSLEAEDHSWASKRFGKGCFERPAHSALSGGIAARLRAPGGSLPLLRVSKGASSMKLHHSLFAVAGVVAMMAGQAMAADLAIVSGDTGNGLTILRGMLDDYEKTSGDKVTVVPMPSSTTDQFGQYKLWLAAGNTDIDVYQ